MSSQPAVGEFDRAPADFPSSSCARRRERGEKRKRLAHLDTVTTVDAGDVVVVLPDNTELNDTLGDLNNVERLLVLGMLLQEGLESGSKLVQGL